MAYVDPSIIQGFKPIELPDPGNALMRALQIQALRGENQLQQLKLGEAQQTANETNALRQYFTDPANAGQDPAAMRAGVQRVAPIAGQPILKNMLDAQTAQANLQKTTLDNEHTQIVHTASLLGAAAQAGPAAVMETLQKSPTVPADRRAAMIQQAQADPVAFAKQFAMGALTPEQQLAQNNPTILPTDQGIAAVNKDGSGGRMVPNITGAASFANGMPGVGPGITGGASQMPQTINQPYIGQQPAGAFVGDPASLYAGLQRISNPTERAQAIRALQNQLAGANPTMGADGMFQGGGAQGPVAIAGSQQGSASSLPQQGVLGAKREEISYHNDPLTGQVMQLPRYAQPGQSFTPGAVQSVGSSSGGAGGIAGLSEAALNDAATRLAHGDSTVLQNYGRGMQGSAQLIAIRNRAAEIAQSEGRSADDQTAAGISLGGERAGARTLGTRSANLGVAANELDKFSDLALSASSSVPRTQFVPLNRLSAMVASGTGSVQQAAFSAANESVINAFAQVAGRGTPTVAGMEHARQMLSTAQTPEQYAAVVKQLKAEARAALDSASEVQGQQRGRITGTSRAPAAPAAANGGWAIERVN